MKTKAFLLLCLFIGSGMTQLSAQKSDNKGGKVVFDTHIVTLRPGVTMDQYVDFLKTKYVSEYDKNFPGSKMIIVSPDIWMKKNQYAFIYIYESSKEWSKYYPNGTEMSAECKAAWEKMNSVKQEESKYILDKGRVENELPQWFNEVLDSLNKIYY